MALPMSYYLRRKDYNAGTVVDLLRHVYLLDYFDFSPPVDSISYS